MKCLQPCQLTVEHRIEVRTDGGENQFVRVDGFAAHIQDDVAQLERSVRAISIIMKMQNVSGADQIATIGLGVWSCLFWRRLPARFRASD